MTTARAVKILGRTASVNQQRTCEHAPNVLFGRLTIPGRQTMLEFLPLDFSYGDI